MCQLEFVIPKVGITCILGHKFEKFPNVNVQENVLRLNAQRCSRNISVNSRNSRLNFTRPAAIGRAIHLIKLLISANLFVQGCGKVYSPGIHISFVNLIANYEQPWAGGGSFSPTIGRCLSTVKSLRVKVHRESITLSLERKYRPAHSNYSQCHSFPVHF